MRLSYIWSTSQRTAHQSEMSGGNNLYNAKQGVFAMNNEQLNNEVMKPSASQFRNWISNPPIAWGRGSICIKVTPEIAYEALTYSEDTLQRHLRPSAVSDYANEMKAGRWVYNHQGICFDVNGGIVDGQHRLHAVVDSGVSILQNCSFGAPAATLDEGAFGTVDIGRKRTAGDIFYMNGVRGSKVAATVTRRVWQYNVRSSASHPMKGSPRLRTPNETYEYYTALDPDRVQNSVKHYYRLKTNHIPEMGAVSALHYVASTIDPDLAEDFFTSLATGSNLGPRSIIKKLRDFLLVSRKSLRHEFVMELVTRAWNAMRTGRRTFDTQPSDSNSPYAKMV
jgi:hypothetical protein